MNIIIALLEWLHLLATVAWIGAMTLLLLVIIPSAKKTLLPNETTFKDLMKAIGKKMTLLVNVSILIFFITGITLGILKEAKTTEWSTILIIKLIIVFLMVGIHFSRFKVIAPYLERKAKEDPLSRIFMKLKKFQMNLVLVNLMLGIIVLLLSVIL
ncbi:MAG: hypothetical protein E3J90_10850 [Promethearchaeota archaeon]|nr:MAG: hypothetical protein E3J90_10850 [Candidatus Lokiarchaeota archaeon]